MVVLFGGYDPTQGQSLGDMWQLDGATWTGAPDAPSVLGQRSAAFLRVQRASQASGSSGAGAGGSGSGVRSATVVPRGRSGSDVRDDVSGSRRRGEPSGSDVRAGTAPGSATVVGLTSALGPSSRLWP
mgnify:CR=1 FL=1